MFGNTKQTKREVVTLNRDCMAMLVPSGARIMLQKDTEVTITQSLGGSYTVELYGNLARIDGKDAEALGKEILDPLANLAPDASVEDKVWAQLKSVYDPEIPVNIVDLGLVYKCDFIVREDQSYYVYIEMTLTAPGCGMGPVLVADVQDKVSALPQVAECEVELVFDPPWSRDMMSDAAKLELGML